MFRNALLCIGRKRRIIEGKTPEDRPVGERCLRRGLSSPDAQSGRFSEPGNESRQDGEFISERPENFFYAGIDLLDRPAVKADACHQEKKSAPGFSEPDLNRRQTVPEGIERRVFFPAQVVGKNVGGSQGNHGHGTGGGQVTLQEMVNRSVPSADEQGVWSKGPEGAQGFVPLGRVRDTGVITVGKCFLKPPLPAGMLMSAIEWPGSRVVEKSRPPWPEEGGAGGIS